MFTRMRSICGYIDVLDKNDGNSTMYLESYYLFNERMTKKQSTPARVSAHARTSKSANPNPNTNTRARAGCIVTDRSWTKVLLVKGFSKWGFPKGHVELGEQLDVAAKREVYEETGMHVDVTPTEFVKYDHITLFYATADECLCVPIHDDEVVQTRWVPVHELYTWKVSLLNSSLRPFVVKRHSHLPLSKRTQPRPVNYPVVDSTETSYKRYPKGKPVTQSVVAQPSTTSPVVDTSKAHEYPENPVCDSYQPLPGYVEHNGQLYSTLYWDQTIWTQWWIMTSQMY